MKTVILCPRREGIEDRDALWAFTRPWWTTTFPDWPLIEGYHEGGPFNRSAALNEASRLAGEWDVALIIDADVLSDEGTIRQAVRIAHEQRRMVVPFDVRHNLGPFGTRKVLAGDKGSWTGYIARDYRDQHSSVVAVSRAVWDAVGGFDEGFRGWGLEDTAFTIAAETVTGQPFVRLPGEVWHLHHAAAKGEKHGSPTHRANMARAARYRAAASLGDTDAIRALVAEGRELAVDAAAAGIPHIIHRVVPETTPAIVERWWAEVARLHPGWRLMTHRDPLIPADWPMTSPLWPRVIAGAQLADLVRLEALLRWGGFYLDMDVQPFRSLEPLCGAGVVAAWEDEKVIPNAVLGARPGHPAIAECLKDALKITGRIGRDHIKTTWDAGPGVMTRVLPKYADALILPPGAFYDVSYRDPHRDALMQAKPAPWTFVRHWYAGSWLPAERQHPLPEMAA